MSNYSATVTPFPQTPVTQRAETEKKASSTSTSSTPWARVRAHARNEDMQENGARSAAEAGFIRLMDYYCDSFGRRVCPPSIQREMIDALKAGMKAKVICLCIDAAQEAERPTWAYARAVMARCIAEGTLTPQQFAERAARRRQRGKDSGGETPTSLRYAQRAYTPEQLAAMIDMFDD